MKLIKSAALLAVCAFAVFFCAEASAVDGEIDVYIDGAGYSVRGETASVRLELAVFVPECAAEGTLEYDSDLLSLKSVDYDKQILNLSYKDFPDKGKINVACYGIEPVTQPEAVIFVFTADPDTVGTAEFSLGDFTVCDIVENITVLKPDAPLALKLENNAEALNPRIDRTASESSASGGVSSVSAGNIGNGGVSFVSGAGGGSVTVRERSALPDGERSVIESAYPQASEFSRQSTDGVYFYDRDFSEYVVMVVFAAVIIAVLAVTVITNIRIRRKKQRK